MTAGAGRKWCHVAIRNEDDMERKAIDILKDWAIPTAAVLVTATGAWVRMEQMAVKTERDLLDLRKELRDGRTAISTGILDPTAHGAMDQQIRHFFEEELGKEGFRRFIIQFSEHATAEK